MANPNKVGLVLGALMGGWHLVWLLLVLLGWAQLILDFVFWAHMIKPIYSIKPFDPVAGVTLVVITGVIGYVLVFSARSSGTGYIGKASSPRGCEKVLWPASRPESER